MLIFFLLTKGWNIFLVHPGADFKKKKNQNQNQNQKNQKSKVPPEIVMVRPNYLKNLVFHHLIQSLLPKQ